MKFRDKLSRHVVVPWESYYIPYSQLKAQLKAANGIGQPPSPEFYTCFADSIVAANAFLLKRQSLLRHEEDRLEAQWDCLSKHREDVIFLSLGALRDALLEILWFCRINYEAMNRLYAKVTISASPRNPEVENNLSTISGHIAKYSQAYTDCAKALERVQARVLEYIPSTTHKSSARCSTGAVGLASSRTPSCAFESACVCSKFIGQAPNLDQEDGIVAAIFQAWNTRASGQTEYGHTLLHFAATYGMANLCSHILNQDSIEKHMSLQGCTGFMPLQTAVFCGQVQVAQLLLSYISDQSRFIPDDLLHIALRREDDAMVQVLVSNLIGLRHKSSSGETCIHIASQLGREDYIRLLLQKLGPEFLNVAEIARQWTPLFVACAQGHTSTAKLLLDASADPTRTDYLGWTAQEHAAFRGHIPAAELFPTIHSTSRINWSTPRITSLKGPSCFEVHKELSHVVINLGGLQDRKLSKSSTLDLPNMLGHGLVLRISTSESATSVERMVPLLDDPVDDTFVFPVENPMKTMMIFNVHKMNSGQDGDTTLIGSGVSSLYAQVASLGSTHATLVREHSVPILCKDTLKVLGTITFSFLVVKPYEQLKSPLPGVASLDASSVQLIGHRGHGQNSPDSFLQLGENTIQSFLAAGMQGAKFVEFDVQLTRDLVPVLFHDYSLSETGTDVPIHDVTLDQFLHASIVQSPRGDPPSMVGEYRNAQIRKPRSRSVTTVHERGAEEVKTRMKYTVDFMNKGFKPNTRGDFVQDTFATLEDVLCNVPEEIGFNMEIKYPRLHEALDASIAPVSIEINIFVDTILNKIARFGGNRKIILSSFTPEICILLAIKQKAYPVFIISNIGKRPMADKEKRAKSLQVGMRFAKQWGLAGLVVAADALVLCPRLIGLVKSKGLICGSYNGLNNKPENVELQVKAGIDLVIADRVGLISATLDKLAGERAASND